MLATALMLLLTQAPEDPDAGEPDVPADLLQRPEVVALTGPPGYDVEQVVVEKGSPFVVVRLAQRDGAFGTLVVLRLDGTVDAQRSAALTRCAHEALGPGLTPITGDSLVQFTPGRGFAAGGCAMRFHGGSLERTTWTEEVGPAWTEFIDSGGPPSLEVELALERFRSSALYRDHATPRFATVLEERLPESPFDVAFVQGAKGQGLFVLERASGRVDARLTALARSLVRCPRVEELVVSGRALQFLTQPSRCCSTCGCEQSLVWDAARRTLRREEPAPPASAGPSPEEDAVGQQAWSMLTPAARALWDAQQTELANTPDPKACEHLVHRLVDAKEIQSAAALLGGCPLDDARERFLLQLLEQVGDSRGALIHAEQLLESKALTPAVRRELEAKVEALRAVTGLR